jgi:hypothetical protein
MRFSLCALVFCALSSAVPLSAQAELKLYWTDINLHAIKRSNVDGSNVETIVSVVQDYAYISASQTQNKIYYTIGSPTPQLWSADFSGTNQQLLATFDSANYTRGLAVNDTNSKVYWSSFDGYSSLNGKIRSANLNGSGVSDLISLGTTLPYGTAIDTAHGKLFWIDTASPQQIETANLNGTGRQTIVSGSAGTAQITYDPVSNKIYWVDGQHGFVYRANVDGSNLSQIGTLSPNGEAGIAVDGALGKVFWSDTFLDKIYSANLDGTGKTAIVSSGLDAPFSLTLVNVPEPPAVLLAVAAALGVPLIKARHARRVTA